MIDMRNWKTELKQMVLRHPDLSAHEIRRRLHILWDGDVPSLITVSGIRREFLSDMKLLDDLDLLRPRQPRTPRHGDWSIDDR